MKFIFYFKLFLVNNFFKGTRFFKIKNALLRNGNISIAENVKIVGPITMPYHTKISIGDNTWIGKDFNIDGNGEVVIGRNCDFGPNVRIATGGHEIGSASRRAGSGKKMKIEIKDGCWICTNVLIINNVVINNSTVVAAGTIVNKNLKSNCLYGGSPARIIKELESE